MNHSADLPGPNSTDPYERRTSPANWAAVLLFLGTAGWLIAGQEQVRHQEARLASVLSQFFLGTGTKWEQGTSIFVFGLGTHHVQGLNITFGCSTVLLLVPLLLVAGGFAITGRARPGRLLVVLAVSSLLLIGVNAVRLVGITGFTLHWGMKGFGWSHTVLGSLWVLFGLVGTLVLFVRWVTGGKKGGGRTGARRNGRRADRGRGGRHAPAGGRTAGHRRSSGSRKKGRRKAGSPITAREHGQIQ
ncbi:archaeosortase/exosortase family protein [Streptomyces sp. NPDC001262]|uniref:archaeosortase/exosortase family protein n=1 Tax=Streptomyces TaxID=1883 RepID=UPI0036BBB90A